MRAANTSPASSSAAPNGEAAANRSSDGARRSVPSGPVSIGLAAAAASTGAGVGVGAAAGTGERDAQAHAEDALLAVSLAHHVHAKAGVGPALGVGAAGTNAGAGAFGAGDAEFVVVFEDRLDPAGGVGIDKVGGGLGHAGRQGEGRVEAAQALGGDLAAAEGLGQLGFGLGEGGVGLQGFEAGRVTQLDPAFHDAGLAGEDVALTAPLVGGGLLAQPVEPAGQQAAAGLVEGVAAADFCAGDAGRAELAVELGLTGQAQGAFKAHAPLVVALAGGRAHAALLVREAHRPFVGAGLEAPAAGFFDLDLGTGGAHHRAARQGFDDLGLGRQIRRVGRAGGVAGQGQGGEQEGGQHSGRAGAVLQAWGGHASLPLAMAGTIQKNTRLVAKRSRRRASRASASARGTTSCTRQ